MKNALKSPLWYLGGKGRLSQYLLQYIPMHHTYVEPFGGGASLLLAKSPSKVEVYNDIYSDVVNFWKVLSNEEDFKQFQRIVSSVPYSRELFYEVRSSEFDISNNISKAIKFFIISRMSFSGYAQRATPAWGISIQRSNALAWARCVDGLEDIAFRLRSVVIENKTWEYIINQYDTEDTFFYLDPPYIDINRGDGGYFNEMSIKNHDDLLSSILNVKGKVLLSGYNNELYEKRLIIENGWSYTEIDTVCYAMASAKHTSVGTGSLKDMASRKECLWWNFSKGDCIMNNEQDFDSVF